MFAAALMLLSASFAGAQSQVVTDDSDLTAYPFQGRRAVSANLSPDVVEAAPSEDGATTVQFVRLVKGATTFVTGLPLGIEARWFWGSDQALGTTGSWGELSIPDCPPGESKEITATLEDPYFSVESGRSAYRMTVAVPCGNNVRLTMNEDSDSGQALGIWQIAYWAKVKLSATVGLEFWRNAIPFSWPADADYYSWGTVHISRGDHWDVVGHEMGHAIYDQAGIGAFGGGQHFIDRCYSGAMALSEGWASYFSAWLSVAPDDADAKFEYMVPRRAPIRFENIPEDVCAGPTNEWRVNGFFWDFIDLNDGEASAEDFARVWAALLNGNARDAAAAAQRIVDAGFDPVFVDGIWQLNFVTAR